MSGGAGPSRRKDGGSSSQLRGRNDGGESSLAGNYPKYKKDLSFDSFIV